MNGWIKFSVLWLKTEFPIFLQTLIKINIRNNGNTSSIRDQDLGRKGCRCGGRKLSTAPSLHPHRRHASLPVPNHASPHVKILWLLYSPFLFFSVFFLLIWFHFVIYASIEPYAKSCSASGPASTILNSLSKLSQAASPICVSIVNQYNLYLDIYRLIIRTSMGWNCVKWSVCTWFLVKYIANFNCPSWLTSVIFVHKCSA